MRHLAPLLAVGVAVVAVAVPFLMTFAAAAASPSSVSYEPPVDGPIVDTWRPPPEDWDPGNRGIDYAPGRGTPVRAAADGEVTFAGQVGGSLHVVILHTDGVRTSYSFLQSVAVHRGDRVRQGEVVGTAGDDLHFGARVGDDYIDPRTLFDGPAQVFLVPDEARHPGTEAAERSGLSKFLGAMSAGARAVRAAGGRAVTYAAGQVDEKLDEARLFAHVATQLHPTVHLLRLAQTTLDWWSQRTDCTPGEVPPAPLPERRVAVLVGGLGSSSGHDSVDEVDPAGLGYERSVRFSYQGGDTAESAYAPRDTTTDLAVEAHRLRELLRQVRAENPGIPIDVIAHSQGGIVARRALAYDFDDDDPSFPDVRNLVTLASPHQGADAATALTFLSHTGAGAELERTVDASGALPWHLQGSSIAQLSETSEFVRDLDARPLPPTLRFTSIGSRGDLVVTGVRTRTGAARNVVVSVAGLVGDHSSLPGSPQGRREVALAIAGMPPTCQSLGNMLADTVVSDGIATAEDALGGTAYFGGRWIDARTP